MFREIGFGFDVETHHSRARAVVALKDGVAFVVGLVELSKGEDVAKVGEEAFDKQVRLHIAEAVVEVGREADALRALLFQSGSENRYDTFAADNGYVKVLVVSLRRAEAGGIRGTEIEVSLWVETDVDTR